MATKARTKAAARRKRSRPAVAPRSVSEPVVEPLTEPAPTDRPARSWTRAAAIDAALAVVCGAFVFAVLRPGLLFAATTPTGGDLGAHVWGPQFLQAHLFDRGLLAGWSNDWFGGFPAYRFYMPVPALGAVLLNVVFSYGAALKLMVALPLVALPLVSWRFGRAAKLAAPGPSLLAIGSLLFLFDSSNVKFGGSIASSIAGEYGNALAITLALWCFAVLATDLDRGRRGPAAGLIGALAACCHPVGLYLVIVGLLAFIGASALIDRARMVMELAHMGLTALLVLTLSAFWYVPFYAYRLYTNDLNFVRVTGLRQLLFPLPVLVELVLGALFLVGVIDAFVNSRRAVMALAMAGGVFALGAVVAPRGMLWNARLAPPWYLAWVLVAGAGAGALVELRRNRIGSARRVWIGVAVPIVCAAVVLAGIGWDLGALPGTTKTTKLVDGRRVTTSVRWLVGPSHTPSAIPLAVDTAFSGYQRGPYWTEYQQLITTMERLSTHYGCGRLMPEFDPTGRYGSVYADDLLPYWTSGCIATVSGLYNDSAPGSAVALVAESALSETFPSYEPGLPYEPLSVSRGVHYLRELGARYYLASSKPAIAQARATAGLRAVATVGSSVVFVVNNVQLVQPLGAEPLVVQGAGSDRAKWQQTALAWFGFANENLARFVTSGPGDWQRVTDTQTAPALRRQAVVTVTDVHVTDRSIRFHVDQIGTPVLVRVSYFPWWHASGAQGPFRAAPNWMIVVPTSHDVVLTPHTQPIEWLATIVTVLAVAFAIALAVWARRRSRAARRALVQ